MDAQTELMLLDAASAAVGHFAWSRSYEVLAIIAGAIAVIDFVYAVS